MAELERMIAADEAADAAGNQSRTPGRNELGQFVSTEGTAASAGTEQAQAEEVVEEGSAASTTQDNSGTRSATTQAAQAQPGEGQQQQQQQTQEPSQYQKTKERAARTWKQINEAKLKLEAGWAKLAAAERAALNARLATPPAPVATSQPAQPPEYTADHYEAAAEQFEDRGDFELADAAREEAKKLRAAQPATHTRQASGVGQAQPQVGAAAWAKAKADFPQIVDPQNPANAQLLQFIREHPQVLDYPQGPYLAAQLVVSTLAAGKVPELQKEAARVPELTKQVETLTAKVKELQALTSLPSSGSPTTAGDARGETPWAQRSTREMEAELDREFAGV